MASEELYQLLISENFEIFKESLLSENTGLQYDKRLKMAFGGYQGYDVSILQTESAAQLFVTFWVKRHDDIPVNPEELWHTSSLSKKIKLKFSYTGHSLRIQMMPKAFSGGVYKHLELSVQPSNSRIVRGSTTRCGYTAMFQQAFESSHSGCFSFHWRIQTIAALPALDEIK